MKIVFPEYHNPIIKQAISESEIDAVPADNLESACALVKSGQADAMIAGIDYSSRDVILACRDHIGAVSATFSASMYFTKPGAKSYLVADCAACKHPTEGQLYDICWQTYQTALKLFDEPRLALLSFSSFGSGGHDDTMDLEQSVLQKFRETHPEVKIDGEMQLDCAIDMRVAQKKAPDSEVAGQANVLICPDLNSGNILYKALEYFGGYSAAGPLLQGFAAPVSDLSRGSTVEDVKSVITTLRKIYE